jgi:hypothetical protein
MNRDLLKEAIADAKAVKETAIANAKAALEEAFTPYLKEKLAAKLSEMDDMEEAEIEEAKKDEKEMKENFDMDESKLDEYAEDQPYRDDDGDGKLDLDEMDLDELLRELDDMEEGKKEDVMEGEDDLINDPKGPTAHGNVAEEEEVEMGEEEDEEIDLENMSEDDLKSFIETVIADMVAAGELEGNIEGGEEEGEEVEIEDEEETDLMERKKYGGNKGDVPAAKRGDKKDTAEEEGVEDYKKKKVAEIYDIGAMNISDAQAILAAIAGVVGVPLASIVAAYAEDKIRGVKDLVKGKKASMKEGDDMYEGEVDEMKKEVEELKKELNEINLLNSKLLYVNKIFKAKNLTESQKTKVLEAFDKATTVKEVKLVFETLSGEVKEKKSHITESMIGGASKAAGIAPTKSPILEVNDQFARWQTLAGIKKQF